MLFMQWAFGVTCWEIFSGGKTPYSVIRPLDLLHQLKTGRRMEKPVNTACTNEVYVTTIVIANFVAIALYEICSLDIIICGSHR